MGSESTAGSSISHLRAVLGVHILINRIDNLPITGFPPAVMKP